MFTLYQFQFSHFCEKVRWALDYKDIPYRPINLLPGLHVKVARRLAPKTCVPILANDQVIQESSAIITHLDQQYPDHCLTPANPVLAKEALDWEAYLDQEIGVTLRLWFFFHALPDRQRTMHFLMQGAPWYAWPLFSVMYPRVRTAMMQAMQINPESARQAEARLLAALERLDHALVGRQHLVDDEFSRADLTACALLSPLCAPGKTEQELQRVFPEPVLAFRAALKSRPFFGWVLDTYQSYR